MKRIIIGIALLSMLSACQTGTEENNGLDNDEQTQATEENIEAEPNNQEAESGQTEDNEEQEYSEESNTDEDSFQEMEVIEEYIDVSDYQREIETDNRNTRVMFFKSDQGEKEYKTVFIKDKSRLKIIHLGEDGLLFNEELN
ncbi:hypothetical protein ACS127_02530 [Amphibacillus sp. Q70]|uniref:hypothetical protein n=1 Tax=Amphibacillus sp. Q70 TaxID=3453416 RepID=UPI003F87B21C